MAFVQMNRYKPTIVRGFRISACSSTKAYSDTLSTINILHITAHLGGGVGKVLSRLVEESTRTRDGISHTIATLEAPEKTQFSDHIKAYGGNLLICPPRDELNKLAATADIVQLEWWHHPAVAAWLGSPSQPPMRLLVWSHISGLHTPALAPAFVATPSRFLFTSPCSARTPRLDALDEAARMRTATVFSSGGFEDMPPPPERRADLPLRIGYLGSLNPAKIHPQFLKFVAAIDDASQITLIGDFSGNPLREEARRCGLASRLDFQGYRTDVCDALSGLDILAYLLNPLHYGTTENALLEAMAMGVVPIVLDNPAECCLVENGRTGLVVHSPEEFAQAILYLQNNPARRRTMSSEASRVVRERFSIGETHNQLLVHYQALMTTEKKKYNFSKAFGENPADWFRSCLGEEAHRFRDDGTIDSTHPLPQMLREQTKGSVFHFARTFPNDHLLSLWAKALRKAP